MIGPSVEPALGLGREGPSDPREFRDDLVTMVHAWLASSARS